MWDDEPPEKSCTPRLISFQLLITARKHEVSQSWETLLVENGREARVCETAKLQGRREGGICAKRASWDGNLT